jgi:hypothetical protein
MPRYSREVRLIADRLLWPDSEYWADPAEPPDPAVRRREHGRLSETPSTPSAAAGVVATAIGIDIGIGIGTTGLG